MLVHVIKKTFWCVLRKMKDKFQEHRCLCSCSLLEGKVNFIIIGRGVSQMVLKRSGAPLAFSINRTRPKDVVLLMTDRFTWSS